AIVTCQAYLSDQSASGVDAVDQAASQPLIQRSIEPSAPSTKIELQPGTLGASALSSGQGMALPPTYIETSAVDKNMARICIKTHDFV
uniref:Uncharacterized protein n=1 Tax=Romanomermis culicivorax TaxID=13658 RepID=A0A915KIU0_ROMCU